MKILKPKVDMVVKCDCGCEFEFELSDILNKEQPKIGTDMKIYYLKTEYVKCPICEMEHDIDLEERIIEEKGEN